MFRAFAVITRTVRALLALAVLAGFTAGVPWLLIVAAGWPLDWIGWPHPGAIPSTGDLHAAVTSPWSDHMVLALLATIGWVLWAQFLRDTTIEIIQTSAIASATRRGQPRPPARRRGPIRWWEDLDLAVEHPVLTICGTIIYIKGKGFFRQEWTKTDAGYRSVVLPRFAVGMLIARKISAADNPNDAIFPSRRGTWLSPPNVRRQWRQARADTGLEWVTPHTFRKTVATLIDKEANTDSAAAQLGHGSKETTKKHYIVKPALAPDSSHILEQLGGRPESGDPEPRHPGQRRAA